MSGGSDFDVLVTGGWLLDGTGAPPYRAEVGVRAGRIAALGRLDGARAPVEIDATGRYVAPGFVDSHVHADALAFDPGVQAAALRQGVTTVVLGQDGLSFAPASPAALAYVTEYFAAVNGAHPDLPDGRSVTVAELLAGYAGRTALNTAYLVPHGTIRYAVLGGAARPAAPAEVAAMRRLVEQGLDEGAVGLSSGLEYVPGGYADAAELAALCAPVAARGLPYVTHMRGYESAAPTGMAEVRAIAAASGVAAHVSHYHGPGEQLVALLDAARAEGLDVTFDSYPYLAGCSILAMVALPGWLASADPDAVADRLADPGVRRRLAAETDPALWDRIALAHVPAAELAWAEGLRLTEAAARAGTEPAAFCADVLIATRLRAGTVFNHPPTNSDAAVRELLRHPAQMAGSDGVYVGGHPHPRGWGTFARLLGRHVRELGDWSWAEAVVHLAAHPARRFRLADRGLLRRGLAADLVVLDPARVRDRADYAHPRELAEGVDDVLVNGVPALRGGTLTGALPGTPLRPD